jgi:hypothetical protein
MGRATSALGWILVGGFLIAGAVLTIGGLVLVVSGLTAAHGTGADVGGIASGSSLLAGGLSTAIGFVILAFTAAFAIPGKRREGRRG